MSQYKIGDCVRITHHDDREGMIVEVYPYFNRILFDESECTKEEWLQMQEVRFTYEELNYETWYVVQLFNGYYVCTSHIRLQYIGVVDIHSLFN
jgi:hypothetical protein